MTFAKLSNEKFSTQTVAGLTTGIGKATVTGTTGSPTVDTSSRAGKTIYKFTGSGSITVGTPGTAEILVIGGGGGAGRDNAGGGAGGYVYETSALLPAGTLTVTVGAGGTAYYEGGWSTTSYCRNGSPSRIGGYIALGGGHSGFVANNFWRTGADGGSGGGGYDNFYAGGSALLGQGNNGSSNAGGGGAGGATPTNGAGGPGASNSITGTSVTYAGGGGGISQSGGSGGGGNAGATGQNGAANKGGGAGGSYSAGAYALGGSGYVVVVVG